MVDGGSLENCCAATHRGFESLFLRKAVAKKRNRASSLRFFDAGLHRPAQRGGMPRSGIPEEEGICTQYLTEMPVCIELYIGTRPKFFPITGLYPTLRPIS